MAKIKETIYVITVSELVKTESETETGHSEEFALALEQVAQELATPGALVEVTKA